MSSERYPDRESRGPGDSGGGGGGVIYHVLRCPDCQSEDVVVVRTERPVRYHKCWGCGHTFKSVEEG